MSTPTRQNLAYTASTLFTLSLFVATNAHHAIALAPLRRDLRLGKRALTYSGCYSSSAGLADQGSYAYQTSSYCLPICTKQNQAVLGLSGGSDCWCGDELPPADTKVSDSNCDTPCNGYGQDMCGGTGFYSVYLTGLQASVPNAADGSSSSSSSSSTSSSSSSSSSSSTTNDSTTSTSSSSSSTTSGTLTATSASVVTSVAPGATVVVTMPAVVQVSSTASPSATADQKSHPNTAGIAAGVVIGVLAVAAIIIGIVLCMRRRRRQEAEDQYKRQHQVSDFMRGRGEPKPPATGYSTKSDARLDPEAGAHRNSAGSIADSQDYSRRILRVANPDSGR